MAPESHWLDLDGDAGAASEPRGWTRAVFSVAEVMFADSDGPPADARLRWLCARVRDASERVGGKGMLAFRAGLTIVDRAAPLLIGRLPPFSSLSFDDRVRALERVEASPAGMSLLAVKAVLSMHYFEHPDVADEIGFDPVEHTYPVEDR